ncbi:hypothetical protein SAMN05877838_0874 [Hoeflea halophila]|uniref:Uncharacterized protein n=1 Tax=Hoeflea halophila TaxID=714899 RepID=A0A286HWZ0_9HYPH|nr:hypothetical protein [Hoeflea halophila]SOE12373.1 hypothetical protein SAMN05877838_0874 [Hoeflea halophila]
MKSGVAIGTPAILDQATTPPLRLWQAALGLRNGHVGLAALVLATVRARYQA